MKDIINGPTFEEIRDAVFPPPTATELPWFDFQIEEEGTTSTRTVAIQGALRQGGGLYELACTDRDGAEHVFNYIPETRKGWVI